MSDLIVLIIIIGLLSIGMLITSVIVDPLIKLMFGLTDEQYEKLLYGEDEEIE